GEVAIVTHAPIIRLLRPLIDAPKPRIVRRKGLPAKALRVENNRYTPSLGEFNGFACIRSTIRRGWNAI
ncbi:MAG: hypothetical protein MUD03_10825, partial [Pirellula sp.]|nr:hypothetical protein [Pirellula sp.]